MRDKYLLAFLCAVVFACSSKTRNEKDSEVKASESIEFSEKKEDVYSDTENSYIQWNADNPHRPDIDYLDIDAEPGPEAQMAYKEYVKNNFGMEHSRTAIVRMYDNCPQFPNGSDIFVDGVSLMKIETDDFVVYSVWRGPVVAKNKETGNWFVVWDEDYHYNTKYVRSEGDGQITMEYIDTPDIDDNTNVIHYNLYTHKYYFEKEKYTGVVWPE